MLFVRLKKEKHPTTKITSPPPADSQEILEADPHQITGQLAGRLLPLYEQPPGLVGMPAILLESARLRGVERDLALLPRFAQHPSFLHPVSALRGHLGHTAGVHALAATSAALVSAADDRLVKVWVVVRGVFFGFFCSSSFCWKHPSK
jgi:hypothetical protein